MIFFNFPLVIMSPTRPLRTIFLPGRPFSPVATEMSPAEHLRSVFSCLSLALLELTVRTLVVSHHRVIFQPVRLVPPPEPPDPPDLRACRQPLGCMLSLESCSVPRSPLSWVPDSPPSPSSIVFPTRISLDLFRLRSPYFVESSITDPPGFLDTALFLAGLFCSGLALDGDLQHLSIRASLSGLLSWAWPINSLTKYVYDKSTSLYAQLFWAWPILTIVGLLYSSWLLFGPVSEFDNTLQSFGAGSSIAGIISSSIFLEMFIISNSSIGMERSIPSSSSLGERSSPHLPFFLRSGLFSDSKPKNLYNILTVLSSCVAACTGSEDTIGFVSTKSGGRSWSLTSPHIVTRLQHSGLAAKLLTHWSSAFNSLSHEDLPCLISRLAMLYCIIPRGCLIPSLLCSPQT
uniref:Uncharacterized protein n=1 Tax=Noccaea caerulescens TaxID=107243 RepID=A0A1J3IZP4_NOCCA